MTNDLSRGNQPKDKTAEIKDQTQQKASELKERVQQKAAELKDQAAHQAASRVDTQRETAAQGIGSIAQALRQTSRQMSDQDQLGMTSYIDQAADQVERLSSYLQSNDINRLVGDVERFARRQPAVFLGGMFLAGLLGARFLKSSSPNQGYRYGQGYYDRDYYGDYPQGYTGQRSYGAYGAAGSQYGSQYGSTYGAGSAYDPAAGSYNAGRTSSPGMNNNYGTGQIPGVQSAPESADADRTRRDEPRSRSFGEPLEE
jgi:hypothetical protein